MICSQKLFIVWPKSIFQNHRHEKNRKFGSRLQSTIQNRLTTQLRVESQLKKTSFTQQWFQTINIIYIFTGDVADVIFSTSADADVDADVRLSTSADADADVWYLGGHILIVEVKNFLRSENFKISSKSLTFYVKNLKKSFEILKICQLFRINMKISQQF